MIDTKQYNFILKFVKREKSIAENYLKKLLSQGSLYVLNCAGQNKDLALSAFNTYSSFLEYNGCQWLTQFQNVPTL